MRNMLVVRTTKSGARQEQADPMRQLLQTKWLYQIISRTQPFCLQPIRQLVEGRQNNDRTLDKPATQQIEAVAIGKLSIKADDIERNAA